MYRKFFILSSLVFLLIIIGGLVLPSQAIQAEDTTVSFDITETTLTSNYPRGMTFTIQVTSEAGDIARATLLFELRTGTRQRELGVYDAATDTWSAHPYADGGGLPPWVDFNYWWLLTDSAGNTFETEPQYGIYADNTREWWSIDTDDLTLYWFGGMPDLGEHAAEALADAAPVFEEGWGRRISYKPLVIMFPDDDVWDEFITGGNNPNALGFTSAGDGYTIQRIASPPTQLGMMNRRNRCGGYWAGEGNLSPEEFQELAALHTIIHEITHLYQSDFRVRGPQYWTEGQANYFAWRAGATSIDARSRMQEYADNGYPLDTLQGGGPSSGQTQAADSCIALEYAVGQDFIQWLMDNYGGLATHRAIIEALPGTGLEAAIEEVLGIPFVDVENQYRAYLGLSVINILPTPTQFVLPTAPAFSFPTPPAPADGSGSNDN